MTSALRLTVSQESHRPLEAVLVHVHPCHRVPSASQLMPLLNLSSHFQAQKRPFFEQLEVDILTALSLMSSRKFTQAIEAMRKIQTTLKALGGGTAKTIAVTLEILCADCMSQHSLQAEKVESFGRVLDLYYSFEATPEIKANNGFPRSGIVISDCDITQLLQSKNIGKLLGILKCCLLTNLDALKAAALKHIEYLIENIGCSIGTDNLIGLVQALIATYPNGMGCLFTKSGSKGQLESFTAAADSVMNLATGAENVD